MSLSTPYYLISESKLLKNLKKIRYIKKNSGAKSLLALKCFSTWGVFDLMKKYLDGTTSSSLYEARLGREKFGKEVHGYSVAFSKEEINKIRKYCNKVIFNSLSQLKKFHKAAAPLELGLRINPRVSYSDFDLANPARRFSRLGVIDKNDFAEAIKLIKGVMFHFNCENADFSNFSNNIDRISDTYGNLLKQLKWVSLGGGIYFTKERYPLNSFCKKIKEFGRKFDLEIYLEPGESTITGAGELITTVLDIVHNEIDIAVVDCSSEAHMLDLLVYNEKAKISNSGKGKFKYMIAGRSCLAGDIFGTYKFQRPLRVGRKIRIQDAAGYTMVKKNWFNGLTMPSIAIKRLNGKIELIRRFGYKDFLTSLG